jgi:biopolymer transport protein ExbD
VAIRPAPGGGITVHVATAARGSATVKVNGEAVPQSNLEARLRQLLASGGQVNVSADAALPFGEVARVVDACHLPGTKVMLVAEM